MRKVKLLRLMQFYLQSSDIIYLVVVELRYL